MFTVHIQPASDVGVSGILRVRSGQQGRTRTSHSHSISQFHSATVQLGPYLGSPTRYILQAAFSTPAGLSAQARRIPEGQLLALNVPSFSDVPRAWPVHCALRTVQGTSVCMRAHTHRCDTRKSVCSEGLLRLARRGRPTGMGAGARRIRSSPRTRVAWPETCIEYATVFEFAPAS